MAPSERELSAKLTEGVCGTRGQGYSTSEAVPMGAHAALGAKGRNHWGEGRHLLTKVDRRPSPLRLLPLAIPSSHPPTGGRSSRALPAFLLHQTASSAVASVATLCFAPTRSTVRQVSRGVSRRTKHLFLSRAVVCTQQKTCTQTVCRFLYWKSR